MSDLSDTGAMVLRSVIARAASEQDLTDWSLGHYRGQISIAEIYLGPNANLLAEAKRAVDSLKARQHGAS